MAPAAWSHADDEASDEVCRLRLHPVGVDEFDKNDAVVYTLTIGVVAVGERACRGRIVELEVQEVSEGCGRRRVRDVPGIGFGGPDEAGVVGADGPRQEAAEAEAGVRIVGDSSGDRRPCDLERAPSQAQPITDVKTERVRERCLDDHPAGPDPDALYQLRPID